MLDVIHSELGSIYRGQDKLEIVTRPGEAGWVLFGPYVDLPAGTYSISFGIAADRSDPVFPSKEVCCHVDVCHGNGQTILVTEALSVADLAAKRDQVTVEFTTETPGCFEFRVFANGSTPLRVQAERSLTMDGDYLGLATGAASSHSLATAYVCGEFVLRHMPHFRLLANHGARVESVQHGAMVRLRGNCLAVRNVEDFQLLQEIFIHNEYNFE